MRLMDAGVTLGVIQDLLAHTSINTTKRYSHTTSEQLKNAMEVLNSYN